MANQPPIKVMGIKEITRQIELGNQKVIQAARIAVKDVTVEIAAKADDLVPFDTGDLSGSQVVTHAPPGAKIMGAITYGGPAAPYAAIQHENTDFWHPPKPPGKNKAGRSGTGPVEAPAGRGAKYLEYPTLQAFKNYGSRIANEIRRLLR